MWIRAGTCLICVSFFGKIFLSGVKPHDVNDGSTTVGFGDRLDKRDKEYYEDLGYELKAEYNPKTDTINVFFTKDPGFIPTDIIVKKYFLDIENIENDMKNHLQEDLEDRVIYYNQRGFDALIIAEYNAGNLGSDLQNLIIYNSRSEDEWIEKLENRGISSNRTNWMVKYIMFGKGDYIKSGDYVTPLYGVHVEGITE